jgi:hypothetical protein
MLAAMQSDRDEDLSQVERTFAGSLQEVEATKEPVYVHD